MMITRLRLSVRSLVRPSQWLTIIGVSLLFGALASTLLAYCDSRTLLGENVWIKPMKFALAFGIYFISLAWFLRQLPHASQTKVWIAGGNVLGLALELPCILIQASRSVRSHFNDDTVFDAALYGVMGIGVWIQTLLLVVLTVLFFDRRVAGDRAYVLAIRCGLLMFLLGLTPGIVMTLHGAHTVGASDGGAGLPILNWSIQAGDLRVPHFIGIHGLQLLPLSGWLVCRAVPAAKQRLVIVSAVIGAYVGLFLIAFGLAVLGQPLLPALAFTN